MDFKELQKEVEELGSEEKSLRNRVEELKRLIGIKKKKIQIIQELKFEEQELLRELE